MRNDPYGMGQTRPLSDEQVDRLWDRLLAARSRDELEFDVRDRLTEHYMPLVYRTAERMAKTRPSFLDIQDFISAGALGLAQAIDNFEPAREVRFTTFAMRRVAGAILDYLRDQAWQSRQALTLSRKHKERRRELEQKFGRPPTPEEMAEDLGISLEEYDRVAQRADMQSMVPLDRCDEEGGTDLKPIETLPDDGAINPLVRMVREEMREVIKRGLSDRQKQILQMYYYDGMNQAEIGAVLNLSESRVCQIHQEMIDFLRTKYAERYSTPIFE